MSNINVNLLDHIGSNYDEMFYDLQSNKHLHYWLHGGRGSLKGSFVYLYIIWSMTIAMSKNEIIHSIMLRKVKDTISDSIFTNLLWAIDILHLKTFWSYTINPLKMTCGENQILFRGCANQRDYEKIKSIKFKNGKVKYVVFEELTEFYGWDEILDILQSILRGTDIANVFYMYNPPPSKNNWVNNECKVIRNDRLVHASTYLTAPKEWLGKIFIQEAEMLKKLNPRKYNHMYLGEVIGEGLEIYQNVEIRTITDLEIKKMDIINRGLDFGYTHASCYCETYFDIKNDIIYIIDEIYLYGSNNFTLASKIKDKAGNRLITGDSEDPRTINEMNLYGLNVRGTKKGHDSKAHGIKWLSDRVKIVIDKKRCPNIANDFICYEKKKDKNGNIIEDYPNEPDGSASCRYSLEKYILNKKLIFGGLKG
jgi:phage terminase large subunit